MQKICVSILIFYCFNLTAQTSKLTIHVLSKTDSLSIPNAFVIITDFDTIALTNNYGLTSFNNISATNLNLVIYKQGFNTFYTTVYMPNPSNYTYLVFLEKDVFNNNFNNVNSIFFFNPNNNYHFVNKNLAYFNFADYFNLKNSFNVFNNNSSYYQLFYNRNIKNNFYLSINNIIIPQSIYSEFLPYLNLSDNFDLIVNYSPFYYSSGGAFFINNNYTKNSLNVNLKYFTQAANQLAINSFYNFIKPLKNIDSISFSTNFNISNPFRYNNYYETFNSNLILSTKLYAKNNFNNQLNFIFNSYYLKDFSPKPFLINDSYKNRSNFIAFSVINNLPINNSIKLQIINNYSVTDKTISFYKLLNNKLTLFNTKFLLEYLLQSSLRINLALENDFIKLNYYNLPNSLITKNLLKCFTNVVYLLNFGTLSTDLGFLYLKPNTYFNYNTKIKIKTSNNSSFTLGYGVVNNLLPPHETTLAKYDLNGNIIGTYYYPYPPIKINTTEAIFNYTDNNIYNLAISIYSDYIQNLYNTTIYPFNTSTKVYNNTYTLNTINVNLKLIPLKKLFLDIDYYNLSLLTEDNISTTLFIPQNGLVATLNYNILVNTNILLRFKSFGETLIEDNNYLDNIFYENSKYHTLPSAQFVDLIINQSIKSFDFTFGIYNIFNNNKLLYKNINPLNIYFGLGYTIK